MIEETVIALYIHWISLAVRESCFKVESDSPEIELVLAIPCYLAIVFAAAVDYERPFEFWGPICTWKGKVKT